MKNHFCSLKPICFLVVFTISLCTGHSGQTVEKRLAGKTIIGGVLNGKAKSLPKPEYPETARRAGIVGQVRIQVLIDETGHVITAVAVGGVVDLSLREASETAALQAVFTPTLLSGKPVKVSGVITYNFVAGQKFSSNEEKLKVFGLSTFLHIAKSFSNDAKRMVDSFEGDDLLGEMIADFPQFSAELREVGNFSSLEPDKRISTIDNALGAIRAKASESDRWQIDLGKEFGEILGPMMILKTSDADVSVYGALDEAPIRSRMRNIGVLVKTAPNEFPKEVLGKLTEFVALAESENLLQGENLTEFGARMVALVETISPSEK